MLTETKCQWKPFGQNIIFQRFANEEKTTGGILIAETINEKNIRCKLIAVGPGEQQYDHTNTLIRKPATLICNPGDIIALRQYDGHILPPPITDAGKIIRDYDRSEDRFYVDTGIKVEGRFLPDAGEDDLPFEPDWNFLLIERDKPKEKSDGGILLPEVSYAPVMTGIVRAAGPGHYTSSGYFVKNELKPGDRAVFSPWGGFEIKFGKRVFWIFQDTEIKLKLDADAPDRDAYRIEFYGGYSGH